MAKPLTPLPEHTEKHMRALLKDAKSTWEYRRIQCVLLRVSLDLSADKVGAMVGLHHASVWRIWSQYLKEGERGILGERRGGRYRAHLSVEEERKFLDGFRKKAMRGELVTVRSVHQALVRKLGRDINPSTIYRMLHRSGWRKVVPKPRHPRADERSREEFRALFPPDRPGGKSGS